MRKTYFNIRKNKGFIGIELVIVAGILVTIGIICYNVIFEGTYVDILHKIKPALDDSIITN